MKMTVRFKLYFAFGLVLVMLGGLLLYGRTRDARIESKVDDLHNLGVLGTRDIGTATTYLQRVRGRGFYHLAVNDAATKAGIERDVESFEGELLAALDRVERSVAASDSRRQRIQRVRALYGEYQQARNTKMYPLSRGGDTAGALRVSMEVVAPLFDVVMRELDALAQQNVDVSSAVYTSARATVLEAEQVSSVISFGAVVVALVAAYLLARSIAERVARLASTARAVRNGDLTKRSEIEGGDEIGELAVAFDEMADELERRLAAERAEAAAKTKEKERLAKSVAAYGAFVERVARGDLAATIASVEAGDELASLGENLSTMARSLRTMTVRAHEAVAALSNATAEILTTTQEHSASAAESAAAVAETVATVEQVSQTSRNAAERAKEVSVVAQRSVEVSIAGREALERAVAGMTATKDQVASIAERILALSEQAQAVGQIITTVNELAEQSNLVALNAAIEAARAGEAGRAFAVVAAEIRALAEQSKRATASVRTILGDVQKSTAQAVLATEEGNRAVVHAVERVREAGGRIEELSGVIASSARAASQILEATQQQATGVTQISQAMQSITQASSQAVEGTRQTERAARDLGELSARLRDAVGQYRT